jgi:phosphate transport system substrate-binding protein
MANMQGIGKQSYGILASAILLLWPAAPMQAQDVTLSARNADLSVQGTLTSYDGELYRLETSFGPLVLDAAAVICTGPGCPDLTAPKSIIRIAGDAALGAALLPPLIAAFATAKGYDLRQEADGPVLLLRQGSDTVLAEFSFAPAAPDAARAAMADMQADLVLARHAPQGSTARVLAQDALVPIIGPDNPVRQISTADLADALAGKITNWQQIGGPDMPLVLHGPQMGSDLASALTARLGQEPNFAQTHPDLAALALAVARDPWALAITGRAETGTARAIDLTDSCGFVLNSSALSVKAEDYPLTLPLFMLTPPRRLPPVAREFLDFFSLPAAQTAIAQTGFVARDMQLAPVSGDGVRILQAIAAMPDAKALPEFQRMARAMQGANRLPMTFRFEAGGKALDLVSQENLNDLAQWLEAGLITDKISFVGFVPDSGDVQRDMAQSAALAETVLTALQQIAPNLPQTSTPQTDGFGAALPMACDTTQAGKRLNQRVEVWLHAP